MTGTNDPVGRDELIAHLFRLFDQGGERVDVRALCAGLTLLSGGAPDDKARVAFELFDAGGEGRIALGDMEAFMAALFSVMFLVSPSAARAAGVGARELARTTAEVCWPAGRGEDGQTTISWDDFRQWYGTMGGV